MQAKSENWLISSSTLSRQFDLKTSAWSFSHHHLDEKSIIFSLRCYWCLIVIEHLIQIPKQGYLCSDILYLNLLLFIWNVYKYLPNKRNMRHMHFAKKCKGFHSYPNIKKTWIVLSYPVLDAFRLFEKKQFQESTDTNSKAWFPFTANSTTTTQKTKRWCGWAVILPANRFVLTENWLLSWSKLALWKPGLTTKLFMNVLLQFRNENL